MAALLQIRRLCNNCTGTRLTGRPTLLPPPPQPVPPAVPRLLSPPFLVMTGGCRQAAVRGHYCSGRSPAAKKQRYITSNDRYKSRAFSPPLVSQCQKSDIIKETLRYYIVAWRSQSRSKDSLRNMVYGGLDKVFKSSQKWSKMSKELPKIEKK